ncbi:MAG: diaminopimelate epimerase, partial [Anaerotignaceae bacterium]
MELKFTKMHGCGNDYIYINCFAGEVKNPNELAVTLSDRNFGIGGDGIVLILPSSTSDAKMRMFNNDGSEGKMCGNAIRCVAKYLYDNHIVKKTVMTIETLSGIKTLYLNIAENKVSSVKVDMGPAELNAEKIPVDLRGTYIIDRPVVINDTKYNLTCVSMGNPHAIVFCDEIKDLNLKKIGPIFENDPMFPDKVNTEFVRVVGKNHIEMRVWERGTGETLACGTGACAAAVAAVLNNLCEKDTDIKVSLLG